MAPLWGGAPHRETSDECARNAGNPARAGFLASEFKALEGPAAEQRRAHTKGNLDFNNHVVLLYLQKKPYSKFVFGNGISLRTS